MLVLGVSAWTRGAGAALVRDGVPLAVVPEERITRKRLDASVPSRAIRACLRTGGVEGRDLDAVVFHEKPLRRFERDLVQQLAAFPRSARTFGRSMFRWLGERLWIKGRLADELGLDDDRVLFVEHLLAHAAAAYLPSGVDEAAVLVVDDEAEWSTTLLARGRAGALEPLEELHLPHSLGLLAAAVTQHLGLPTGRGGEGRAAELAAHGSPRASDAFARLLRVRADGAFEVDAAPFRFAFDEDRLAGPGLAGLLGPARLATDPLRFAAPDARDADLAAGLQDALERALLALARRLHERVPCDTLCLGGEVAQNARAVGRLLRESPFARVIVPPAPGDDGTALGAALAASALLAPDLPRAGGFEACLAEPVVEDPGDHARALADDDAVVDALTEALARGGLAAWVRDRAESSDRGLGRRVLLADPRASDALLRLRRAVKPREAFRVFHPALPLERAAEFVEVPRGGLQPAGWHRAELVARDALRAAAPELVQVDGSCRPLLVDGARDPLLHRLLLRVGETTGAPVLLCTSFHGRGDPLVRTEAEARRLAERAGIDALVVERRLYVGS